jgi:hypothetical protein
MLSHLIRFFVFSHSLDPFCSLVSIIQVPRHSPAGRRASPIFIHKSGIQLNKSSPRSVQRNTPTIPVSGSQQLVALARACSGAARRQEIRGSSWKRGRDKRDNPVVAGDVAVRPERHCSKWNIIKIQGVGGRTGDGSRVYLSAGGCEGGDGDGLRRLAGVRALSLTVTYGPFSRDYTQPSDLMRKRRPRIRRTLVTASTRILGPKQGNVFRRSGFQRKFHRRFN